MGHTVVQDVAAQQYEQEFEAFQSGKYKESAQNWLHSSWQGDALQAGTCVWSSHMLLPVECILVLLRVWAIVLPQQNSRSFCMWLLRFCPLLSWVVL